MRAKSRELHFAARHVRQVIVAMPGHSGGYLASRSLSDRFFIGVVACVVVSAVLVNGVCAGALLST